MNLFHALVVSMLLVGCRSSSTSPADAGASPDARARCPRVLGIRGADVALPQLELQLRSTSVRACSPDGKSMRATMNISAMGVLVNAAAERSDTGILAACLQSALGSTVWPSSGGDYSITIDVAGECGAPAASVEVPNPFTTPPKPYADGAWRVTMKDGHCEAVNQLCPPGTTCTPRAPYACPANVPASAMPITVIHMQDATCNVQYGDEAHLVTVNVPCPK